MRKWSCCHPPLRFFLAGPAMIRRSASAVFGAQAVGTKDGGRGVSNEGPGLMCCGVLGVVYMAASCERLIGLGIGEDERCSTIGFNIPLVLCAFGAGSHGHRRLPLYRSLSRGMILDLDCGPLGYRLRRLARGLESHCWLVLCDWRFFLIEQFDLRDHSERGEIGVEHQLLFHALLIVFLAKRDDTFHDDGIEAGCLGLPENVTDIIRYRLLLFLKSLHPLYKCAELISGYAVGVGHSETSERNFVVRIAAPGPACVFDKGYINVAFDDVVSGLKDEELCVGMSARKALRLTH